jgi:hypothetical protein
MAADFGAGVPDDVPHRPLRHLWHALFGHPPDDIVWGTLASGGCCTSCGMRFHRGWGG